MKQGRLLRPFWLTALLSSTCSANELIALYEKADCQVGLSYISYLPANTCASQQNQVWSSVRILAPSSIDLRLRIYTYEGAWQGCEKVIQTSDDSTECVTVDEAISGAQWFQLPPNADGDIMTGDESQIVLEEL